MALGQRTDGRAEAVRGDQAGDRAVRRGGQAVDQIGQHRAGLHRGQLVGIAHQDQTGVRAHRSSSLAIMVSDTIERRFSNIRFIILTSE